MIDFTLLLADLEARLKTAAPGLARELRRGHNDPSTHVAAIAPICGYEGTVILPPDVIDWWRWHDGIEVGVGTQAIGGGFDFISVREVVDYWTWRRDMAYDPRATAAEIDAAWPPSWMPVVRSENQAIALDLDSVRGNHGEYWLMDREEIAPLARVVASEWRTVVGWWREMLVAGAARWDEALGQWVYDEQFCPAHLLDNVVARP